VRALLCFFDNLSANIDACAERFLAQYVQILLHSFDRFFRMHRCCGSDYDSIKSFLLEHLIIVGIQSHAKWLEVFARPLMLFNIG
jgi:hypothetical protein